MLWRQLLHHTQCSFFSSSKWEPKKQVRKMELLWGKCQRKLWFFVPFTHSHFPERLALAGWGTPARRNCRPRAVMRHQGELDTRKIPLQQGESGQGGGWLWRQSLGNCVYSLLLRHCFNLLLHPSPITTTPHTNKYDQSTGSRMWWR